MSDQNWQEEIDKLKSAIETLSSSIVSESGCCKKGSVADCSVYQSNSFLNGLMAGRIYHNCIASNSSLTVEQDVTFENCVFLRDELVTDNRLIVECSASVTFINCLFVGVYSSSQQELMRNGGEDYLNYSIADPAASCFFYGCRSYNYMLKSPSADCSFSCDWEFAHTRQENRLDISPDALKSHLECDESSSPCSTSVDKENLSHLADFFRSGYKRA